MKKQIDNCGILSKLDLKQKLYVVRVTRNTLNFQLIIKFSFPWYSCLNQRKLESNVKFAREWSV